MLNCVTRLQAVVEIITNETARALNWLAKQSTKTCNAIYQNRLALDYLLASEGGVYGKFNLSNCCLQIDDEGKVKEEITDRMRKLAHVSIQTWRGWDPKDLFGGWFSALSGLKILMGQWALSWEPNAALPGAPGTAVYQDYYGGHYRRKTAPHVMMLWKYKPLDQDDAL
jgi:hypothetical protein